jgi:hypothetical protein
MKRRHHTPEQIIRLLAEGEKLLGQGQPVESPGIWRSPSRPGSPGGTSTAA